MILESHGPKQGLQSTTILFLIKITVIVLISVHKEEITIREY